jgi:hypothetical protein
MLWAQARKKNEEALNTSILVASSTMVGYEIKARYCGTDDLICF